MNLNIVLRGQSNASIFGTVNGGAVLHRLEQDVQTLLGFNGINDTVTTHFRDWTQPGPNTDYIGAFLTDWIHPADGNWQHGWAIGADEQGYLNYLAGMGAERDDPTAILFFHTEWDSFRADLTTAEWESGLRFDAALTRAALGQAPATVPYLFVDYAIDSNDAANQAIRVGMQELAANPFLNADIATHSLDINADWDDLDGNPATRDYGGGHISGDDAMLLEARIARSLGETWAAYAKPGSPVALAGGNFDDHGPQVVQASLTGGGWQLSLHVAFDHAVTLLPLDAEAARGTGWSVHSAAGVATAIAATVTGPDSLVLTFDSPVPAGGLLYYGYGYGRLADSGMPGQGNAVYDNMGFPIWVDAHGLAVTSGAPASQPVSQTVGAGPDALQLLISQDQYQGSALYTVAVDGKQVGGVLTASALHASGGHDAISVLGDWGPGSHTATVTFLNDAWAGTPATDRNLHVDGMVYDGTAVAGAAATIYSASAVSFGFHDPFV